MGSRDTGIRVEGLTKVVKALEEEGVALQDLKDAFTRIASKAAELASSYAPQRTGRLRGSIKGSKTKNRASVKAGSARIPYAGPINYGWKARNIHPALYMQKADEAIRPDLVPMLEEEINNLTRDKGLS